MQTKLLFVCLGNICRSPAAEGVFLHLISAKDLESSYLVDSAGTGSWHVGRSPDHRMKSAAQRRGISLVSKARQINVDDFKKFDLILTMDNDNYQAVRALAKESKQENNSLIKPILSFAKNSKTLEVPDPYYGGDKGFDEVLDLLEDACLGLLDSISNSG